MVCVSQTPTALLLVSCLCRVTHPWTLNLAVAKYYRPIRLAAGFQKRSATPASYYMQSHMDFNRIWYRYENKPSNIVEFCNSCWKMAKNAPFHIKSPVKNFCGRAKGGGIAP